MELTPILRLTSLVVLVQEAIVWADIVYGNAVSTSDQSMTASDLQTRNHKSMPTSQMFTGAATSFRDSMSSSAALPNYTPKFATLQTSGPSDSRYVQPLPLFPSVNGPPLSSAPPRRCYLEPMDSKNLKAEDHKHLHMRCNDVKDVNFVILGHWDRCAHTKSTQAIYEDFDKKIYGRDPADPVDFVLSIGATSISDDPCINGEDWSKLWADDAVPWLSVIGQDNHDEELENQMAYSQTHKNWIFPSRNYAVDIHMSKGTLRIIIVDTKDLSFSKTRWFAGNVLSTWQTLVVGYNDIYSSEGKLISWRMHVLDSMISLLISSATIYISAEEEGLELRYPFSGFRAQYLIAGGGSPDKIKKLKNWRSFSGPDYKRSTHGYIKYTYGSEFAKTDMQFVAIDDNGAYIDTTHKETYSTAPKHLFRAIASPFQSH